MSFQIRILRNEVSPRLAKLFKSVSDPKPALEAGGLQLVSITQRAFRETSFRMAPWAPKSDGSPSNLTNKGTLKTSIHIVSLTKTSVTVGTDRPYAAIHQFGGTIKPKPGKKFLVFQIGTKKIFARKVVMPPRPFFPISKDGQVWSVAQAKVLKAMETALNL